MSEPVIKLIPREVSQLIPLFKGDKRQLSLYLRKCQYIIDRYGKVGDENQNLYVYNVLTSRLTEEAAALLSEREDIVTWSELKELLIQHFGDPRSEACINIELESLKIKSGESFLDFCNRIQSVRSLLMSKVNMIADSDLKRAKLIIYNNTALNVFLYNLPENMVRVVRLKAPATLEAALTVVLEEVNFLEQYNMRNRIHGSRQIEPALGSKPLITQPTGFKPMFQGNNNNQPKFNFGIPQNTQIRTLGQPQNYGTFRPPTFGYKPQFGLQPQQQTGFQQFGYRPPQQFGYKPPQQLGYQQGGYRPPQAFGYKPTQAFGYRPEAKPYVQPPRLQTSDVTMRTAVPKAPQQGFRLNELTTNEYDPYYDDSNNYNYNYNDENQFNYSGDDYDNLEGDVQNDETEQTGETQHQDFQITASIDSKS